MVGSLKELELEIAKRLATASERSKLFNSTATDREPNHSLRADSEDKEIVTAVSEASGFFKPVWTPQDSEAPQDKKATALALAI